MNESIFTAIEKLEDWIEWNGWTGYDPFDGLSAPFARKFTFENPILRIALQQTVRRLPFNIRPLLGVTKKHSNQAMGYFASAFVRLFSVTGNPDYLEQARYCLDDLLKHTSPNIPGFAWGWAFDYQSRGHFLPQGIPSVVWTSFIAHAFLDAYEAMSTPLYLDVAHGVSQAILHAFPHHPVTDDSLCISYVPHLMLEIHNANMLAASVLARVYKHTGERELFDVAQRAIRYTMNCQRADASWWYGEGLRWRWVDGYHTGFVLDALYWYQLSTADTQFEIQLKRGMAFYRKALFEGPIARHYDNRTQPIDIQSISQAIQTFSWIPDEFGGDPHWAEQVALWAIEHMQDSTGYFYFRKGRYMTNKTPLLHWGQATMLAALALLAQREVESESSLVHDAFSMEAK